MAHARLRDAHRTLPADVSSNDGNNRGPPRHNTAGSSAWSV